MHDVIVIGAGHAGVEAACAAARRGADVALVTFRADDIGRMSCNPSIGGVGKGHLVREVDALGGVIARAADRAAIHRRMLNSSKGSAVHGPRVQADRRRFAAAVQALVDASGVTVIEGEVAELLIDGGRCRGVTLRDGTAMSARAVVLATGTFLGATLHRGDETWQGGRSGGAASVPLAAQFSELGLAQGTLKTGTPPRLDGRSIDWVRCAPQPSDRRPWTLALEAVAAPLPQLACAITRTTPEVHDRIRDGLSSSPLFSGAIQGRGPRYCPSVEDKVIRFGDRDGHQIFLEPEGLDDVTVYPNGISTSLSREAQDEFVAAIPGLERVRILEHGYAVEYHYADPRRLDATLAHHDLPGLFLAGQINGTTGYEEAAAQGLVAGANAAACALDKAPFLIDRTTSYVGVMIDDLTLQGVSEPYRMLTARSEHRLFLRADNAVARLGRTALELQLLDPGQAGLVRARLDSVDYAHRQLHEPIGASELGVEGESAVKPYRDWLTRDDALASARSHYSHDDAMLEAIDDIIYEPYVTRQRREVAARERDKDLRLDPDFAFDLVPGLSNEMRERLGLIRPANLDEASRIPGVTPAALSALHFALVRRAA